MPAVRQKTALLIAGPTASGKSALALNLAEEQGAVIINADSMQVYRELRILTARPGIAEEKRVPHRLFGHVSGAEAYSVARWLEDVARELQACWHAGRPAIICGGTGLYFTALQQGLAELPPIPAAVRTRWRDHGGDLHAELARRDPETASRLSPADRQRLARALEVLDATGRSLSAWQKEAQARSLLQGVSVQRLYMEVDRRELYARAERRFDLMIEAGALEEVRALPDLPPSSPLLKAIGVRELQSHLRGEIPLDDAVARAKTATRNYIKRQLTWWRPRLANWTMVSAGIDGGLTPGPGGT